MTTPAYLLCAVALGMLLSVQPAINSAVARELASPLFASLCSLSVSLLLIAVAWATIGGAQVQWSKIAALPWWVVVGGAAGALFVSGGVLLAPRIGVAMFFVCAVAGQLLGAALTDWLGAFGTIERAISGYRVAGIGLVFAGAVLAQWGD